jgi:hypothetical protein
VRAIGALPVRQLLSVEDQQCAVVSAIEFVAEDSPASSTSGERDVAEAIVRRRRPGRSLLENAIAGGPGAW